MKHGSASLSAIAALLALTAMTACAPADYPAGKDSYVGVWSLVGASGDYYELNIEADIHVDQYQTVDGVESSISGAITEWRGDNFVVLLREFIVDEVPHEVEVDDRAGGTTVETRMTVDGFELTKR